MRSASDRPAAGACGRSRRRASRSPRRPALQRRPAGSDRPSARPASRRSAPRPGPAGGATTRPRKNCSISVPEKGNSSASTMTPAPSRTCMDGARPGLDHNARARWRFAGTVLDQLDGFARQTVHLRRARAGTAPHAARRRGEHRCLVRHGRRRPRVGLVQSGQVEPGTLERAGETSVSAIWPTFRGADRGVRDGVVGGEVGRPCPGQQFRSSPGAMWRCGGRRPRGRPRSRSSCRRWSRRRRSTPLPAALVADAAKGTLPMNSPSRQAPLLRQGYHLHLPPAAAN